MNRPTKSHDTLVYRLSQVLQKLNQGESLDPQQLADEFGVNLEDRLISISKRASRTIKSLVIDGNNLCYQQQNFIGLVALHAVAKNLSRSYPVLIVFDATIRKWLAMNDRDIAASFGDAVKVHVVATKQKADETLLDSAMDSTTYVISNDRFVDYPDKSAVRDQRVIRHEILNGKVFVHDLGVVENYPTAG
jgi:rRNA-processing protein FCF1